jgi:plastocyanin
VATAVAVGFVALAVPAIVMTAAMMSGGPWGMMGGHGGMMGGRGSSPANETPVQGATQVRIEDFAFAPANIIINVGATVTWTNYDGVDHTVTSDDGDELDSSLFGRGDTYSHAFTEPGEYYYHCEPHPNMKGLVTVRSPG